MAGETSNGAAVEPAATNDSNNPSNNNNNNNNNKPSRYVCPDCGRSYKAVETLNRHRKNHSDDAQYECDVCEASFKRKDLLDRHMNIHSDGHQGAVSHRSQRACLRCSRLKTRCDNADPCSRCVRGNHECVYRDQPTQNRISKPQLPNRTRTNSTVTGTDGFNHRDQAPAIRTRNNTSNPTTTAAATVAATAPHLEQAFVSRTRTSSAATDNPMITQPDMILPPFTMDGQNNMFSSAGMNGFDWQMDTTWLDSLPQITPLNFGDLNGAAQGAYHDTSTGMLWDVVASLSPPDQSSSHSAASDPFLNFDPTSSQWNHSPWTQNAHHAQHGDMRMDIDSNGHPHTPTPRGSSHEPRSHHSTPSMGNKPLPRPELPPSKKQIIFDLTKAVLDLRGFYRNPQDRASFWLKASRKVELAFGIEKSASSEHHALRQFIDVFFQKFNIRFPFVWNLGVEMDQMPPYLYLVMSAIGAAFGDTAAVDFYGQAIDSLMGKLVLMALQRELSDEEALSMCQSLTLIQASMLFMGARKSFFVLPQQVGAAVVLLARRINLFNEGGPHNVERYLEETSPSADDSNERNWIEKQIRRRLAMAILRLEVFISMLLGTRPMVTFEEINLYIPLSDTMWLQINGRNGPTDQEQDLSENETTYLSDLVRIALDKDEPLPSNLQPYHLESVLYGLQYYVWRFSQDQNLSNRLDIDFDTDDDDDEAADPLTSSNNAAPTSISASSSSKSKKRRPERDLLDFSRRGMSDLKNDYNRTVSALHKWKTALTSSARADHLQIERKSLLASYLLYNVAFMRLKADLAALHRLALRCIKDEKPPQASLTAAYRWAASKRGALALEHACSSWLLITNELRRPKSSRADFNILSSVALLHAAVVVWAYAGCHSDPGGLTLEGPVGAAAASMDLRLYRANNFPLMQSFAKLLKEVQPMRPGVKTSAYHHTVATLASKPIPALAVNGGE